MSERLEELRRQRALLEEHLAWLDREIAAAVPQLPVPASVDSPASASTLPPLASVVAPDAASTSSPEPAGSSNAPMPTSGGASAEIVAEQILEEYRVAPEVVRQDVRKGCFLYFAVACVIFALALVALYFVLRSS